MAQEELKGDTIYVKDNLAVRIEFPTNIYQAQLVDTTAPYKIIFFGNTIVLRATVKNAPCQALLVVESATSRNSHRITLCYNEDLKKDVNDFYDFSTIEKLRRFNEHKSQAHVAESIAIQTPDYSRLTYDSLLNWANKETNAKNYKIALAYLNKAQEMKPNDFIDKIKIVKDLMRRDSITLLDKETQTLNLQYALSRKKGMEAVDAYNKYTEAADLRDYEAQYYYLTKYIELIPNDSVYTMVFNTNQFSKNINFARKKRKDIQDYWGKTGVQHIADSLPYITEDFEKKYPAINIRSIPEQNWEALDNTSIDESLNFAKSMLAEAPRLQLSDSVENAKITIEGLNFIKGKMYAKIKINNSDTSDFITGAMNINKGNKGKEVKFYPDFISSRPVVLPGKQYFIIYSCKQAVDNNEDLYFEMSERRKNITLRVKIPIEDYNKEKAR